MEPRCWKFVWIKDQVKRPWSVKRFKSLQAFNRLTKANWLFDRHAFHSQPKECWDASTDTRHRQNIFPSTSLIAFFPCVCVCVRSCEGSFFHVFLRLLLLLLLEITCNPNSDLWPSVRRRSRPPPPPPPLLSGLRAAAVSHSSVVSGFVYAARFHSLVSHRATRWQKYESAARFKMFGCGMQTMDIAW